MRRTEEYLRYAKECRELARTMAREDQRGALVRMAETWEQLAKGHDAPTRTIPERDMMKGPERETK
jgi:hypothetical protein